MALDDLPPELWARICVQLNRHDLAILARLNSNFRDTARYHLYEWITLRSDARSVVLTMRLLARSPALAQRVSRLDIITHPLTRNAWLDTDILTNMSNLRRIRFSRFPCKTLRRYASLVLLLSQSCPQLATFEVKDVEWPAASPVGKLGPINFPMMSTIRWNGEIGSQPLDALSMIDASLSTITTLSLILSPANGNDKTLQCLSQLRLLHLQYLTFSADPVSPHSPYFTRFLVEHPSLRYLHLPGHESLLERSEMTLGMLPQLNSVSGFLPNLTALADKCDSLKFVRSLVLLFPTDRTDEDLDARVQEFLEFLGPVSSLKHCTIRNIFNIPTMVNVLQKFHYAFSEVEWWTLDCYYRNHLHLADLEQSLSRFKKLKRIDLGDFTEPDHLPTLHQTLGLRQIASKLFQLQRVTLYMPHSSADSPNEISCSFRVRHVMGPPARRGATGFQSHLHGHPITIPVPNHVRPGLPRHPSSSGPGFIPQVNGGSSDPAADLPILEMVYYHQGESIARMVNLESWSWNDDVDVRW